MSKIEIDASSLRNGAILRDILRKQIAAKTRGEKKVALLLSSGVDSTTAGMVAHDLGKQVHAYTFVVENSDDFDLRYAKETARIMNWQWTPIVVKDSVTPKQLLQLQSFNCRRKREFECAWPFLTVYPRIEERVVLNGLNCDNHFVFAREPTIQGLAGPNSNKKDFVKFRQDSWGPFLMHGDKALCEDYNPGSAWQHLQMQTFYKKVGVNPYRSKEVFNFLIGFSWQQLNLPRQKHFLVGAFPEFYKAVGHRNHRPYNLIAETGRVFDRLLTTRLNFGKRKRTVDMFRDWERNPEQASKLLKG